MSEVRQFSRYKRLPKALERRMCDYFESRHKGLHFDEDKILTRMSEVLRDKLLQFECKTMIRNVAFLRDADPCFVGELSFGFFHENHKSCEMIKNVPRVDPEVNRESENSNRTTAIGS